MSSTATQSDEECSKSKANQTANTENTNMDLKALCLRNFNKLIIAHLNINSLRKKFEFLISLIKDNIDVLMISETKLDQSFPTDQLMINGFIAPFRLDRNDKGGGVILYIKEDIQSRLVSTKSSQVECFFVEINLQSKKNWLLCCSYNPKNDLITKYLYALSKSIDILTSKYDKLLFKVILTRAWKIQV